MNIIISMKKTTWLCAVCLLLCAQILFVAAEETAAQSQYEKLSALVKELQEDVEALRGIPFKSDINARVADAERVDRFLQRALDDDPFLQNEEQFITSLRYFGFIKEDIDLRALYVDLFTEQIGGFFDEKERVLFVTDRFLSGDIVSRSILAHEMCHALQDQYYDLNKMLKERKTNDDALLALMAVVEGDATLLMNDYTQAHMSWKNLFSFMKTLTYDQNAFLSAPYFIQTNLLFPYMQGLLFVTQGALNGGTEQRNALFRFPPMSTEQIIHPEKYYINDVRDEPTSVTISGISEILGAGWNLVYQNNVGEFFIRTLFEQNDMKEQASTIAAGWDGDWFHLYDGNDASLLIWRSVWDSPVDAEEFYSAFCRLQKALYPEARLNEHNDIFFIEAEPNRISIAIDRDNMMVGCSFTNADNTVFSQPGMNPLTGRIEKPIKVH